MLALALSLAGQISPCGLHRDDCIPRITVESHRADCIVRLHCGTAFSDRIVRSHVGCIERIVLLVARDRICGIAWRCCFVGSHRPDYIVRSYVRIVSLRGIAS